MVTCDFFFCSLRQITHNFMIFNSHIMISITHILILLLTITLSQAIFLPLVPRRPRCMMVYTVSASDSQSVKIFLDLPQLDNHQSGQYYTFSIKNTETDEIKQQTIQYGTFNREYDLSPNVIYQACIQLLTNRAADNIVIYYKAETVYNIEHSELKVPDNLLKKEDFKGAYQAAYHIEKTVQDYKTMQQRRDVTSNEQFVDTKAVDSRLITISILEIAIVLGAGIYQFYSLKNYLVTKQYI